MEKAEVQEDQAHRHPDLPDGTPWMWKEMMVWETWCFEQKRRNNSQGKDLKHLKKTVREGTPVLGKK